MNLSRQHPFDFTLDFEWLEVLLYFSVHLCLSLDFLHQIIVILVIRKLDIIETHVQLSDHIK